MTPPQHRLWRTIAAFIDRHGYSPQIRELCAAVSVKGTSSIHGSLRELDRQGVIKVHPRRNRGIELLRRPPPLLAMDARQHLMWAMKTKRPGQAPAIQPLSLAFMASDAPTRLKLDPTIPAVLVRVRVTIEEIEEEKG